LSGGPIDNFGQKIDTAARIEASQNRPKKAALAEARTRAKALAATRFPTQRPPHAPAFDAVTLCGPTSNFMAEIINRGALRRLTITSMKRKTANIDIRVEPRLVDEIDDWRNRQRVLPSRTAAIVYMLKHFLKHDPPNNRSRAT
jgi:hypothetical protein